MATPRELIRRAEELRQPVFAQLPAPEGIAVTPQQPQGGLTETLRPSRRHCVYQQLMRNHDRMHSRHLQG